MSKLPQDASAEMPVERQARAVMRRSRKASLATLDAATGAPYVSLVAVATDMDCSPLLLLSGLARHTANLKADGRVSLLFDGTGADGDPLDGGRVTVSGRLSPTDREADGERFLLRHPEARGYASFNDYTFYRMAVDGAHYVGGFGRIVSLTPEQILLDPDQVRRFAAAEASIMARMNADHSDVLGQWVADRLKLPAGAWTVVACDPEGCDLSCDGNIERLDFTVPLGGPASAAPDLNPVAEDEPEES